MIQINKIFLVCMYLLLIISHELTAKSKLHFPPNIQKSLTIGNEDENPKYKYNPPKNFGLSVMPFHYIFGRGNLQLEYQPHQFICIDSRIVYRSYNLLLSNYENERINARKYSLGASIFPFSQKSSFHIHGRIQIAHIIHNDIKPEFYNGNIIVLYDTLRNTNLIWRKNNTLQYLSIGFSVSYGFEKHFKNDLFFRWELGVQYLPYYTELLDINKFNFKIPPEGSGNSNINPNAIEWYIYGFGSILISDFTIGFRFGDPVKTWKHDEEDLE